MKILHLIASIAKEYGGPSKACIEMCNAIGSRGHSVELYSTDIAGQKSLSTADLQENLNENVKLRVFPGLWPRFWKPSLVMAWALHKHIAEFDLVHIHSLYLFHNLAGGYFCRKYGVPYIIRPHGTLDPFLYNRHRWRKFLMENLFENRNLKNAAAIHFTTEEEMELARPHTFETPGIVIPNGLHIEEYKQLPEKGAFRQQYPETAGKKLILFFSRINFKKGLDLLIPAYIRLAKQHPEYHLVLVGPDDSNLIPGIIRQLNQAGLSTDGEKKRVTITGMITGKSKLAALNDADVFVLPSYSENFGIAVIEAMICALPVVISDKVNIWREVVADGAGIAGPCDREWFAREIDNLLQNPDLQKKMGEHGIESVKKRYSWNQIALQLESAYTEIIARNEKQKSARTD